MASIELTIEDLEWIDLRASEEQNAELQLKVAKPLLDLRPTSGHYLESYCYALALLGRYDDVIVALHEHRPSDDPEAFPGRCAASIARHKGDYADGKHIFIVALALNPAEVIEVDLADEDWGPLQDDVDMRRAVQEAFARLGER